MSPCLYLFPVSFPEISILNVLYYFKKNNKNSCNGPIGSIFWFKMHLLFKEISNHLRCVASFHIDEDIAKTTRSGVSKTAIIILFTVNTVILFNLAPIFCNRLSCLLQYRVYSPAKTAITGYMYTKLFHSNPIINHRGTDWSVSVHRLFCRNTTEGAF